MRSMRIVRGRREGRCVYYTLDDQHVLDLFQQGLRHVSRGARVVAAVCQVCEVHAESVFKIEGMDCHEEVAILERG